MLVHQRVAWFSYPCFMISPCFRRVTGLHRQNPDAHPGGQRHLGALREVQPILARGKTSAGRNQRGSIGLVRDVILRFKYWEIYINLLGFHRD